MLKRMFVLVIMLFLIAHVTDAATFAGDTEALKKLSLLKFTERAKIIFTGTVQHKNYVYREGVRPNGGAAATTDIIVRVSEMIKGEANFGENHVKFMIEGGEFFSARTGKIMRAHSTLQPKFEVGEKVLLFLAVPKSNKSYHVNYAHDGLHVLGFIRGKKAIIDDTVQFTYVRGENKSIEVKLPVDLALGLGKAYIKSPDSAQLLENEIKDLALGNTAKVLELSKSMITRLKSQSQTIIDRRK